MLRPIAHTAPGHAERSAACLRKRNGSPYGLCRHTDTHKRKGGGRCEVQESVPEAKGMSDRQLQCAKCGSAMEAGFIVDYKDYASTRVETWVEGEPTTSFWTGLKIKDRQQFTVTSYRCERCGYLESYALDEL